MTTYYVQLDTDGLIQSLPATAPADGLTAIQVPDSSAQWFTRYWQTYRIVNGKILAPSNLPDISLDILKATIDNQAETIGAQTTDIASLQTDNATLKQMAAGLTMQLAQLKADTTETTTEKAGV